MEKIDLLVLPYWPCDLAILEVDLPAEVQTSRSSDQGSLSEFPITVL